MNCPCCGTAMKEPEIKVLAEIELSSVHRTMLTGLSNAYPGALKMEELVAMVYGRKAPRSATPILRVQMTYLRGRLRAYGWTVPRGVGGPGNEAAYRLSPATTVVKPRFRKVKAA